jgi:hypothetical protein
MKPEHKPQYQINRTEEFIKKSQELRSRYNRVTDLINAIDWVLTRKPHFFTNLIGEYYLLVTDQLSNPDFPKVKVFYRIIEETNIVVLIDIEED